MAPSDLLTLFQHLIKESPFQVTKLGHLLIINYARKDRSDLNKNDNSGNVRIRKLL